MEECIFCKIVAGEIPLEKVFENEYVLAFKDINPLAPIHVLIIPKIHIKDANDITEENIIYVTEIFKAIKEVAKRCGAFEDGYRLISNCGENGGPLVKHLHFHLIGGKKLDDKLV